MLLIITLSLLLQGCASSRLYVLGTMEEPEFEYQDYVVKDVGLRRAQVDLLFKVHNPNYYEIDSFFVSYDLYVKGKLIAEGKHIKVQLIPEGTSEVTVPVVFSYTKLADTVDIVAEMIKNEQRKVEATINLRVFGEYLVADIFGKQYTNDYFYETDVKTDIELPEVSLKDVGESIKNKFKSLFKSDEG